MARANSIQFGAEFRITVDDDAPREMRKQIRTVNQILSETLPAQEKAAREQEVFAMRQKLVTAEFEKGEISAEHYAEALAYLQSNLSSSVNATKQAAEADKQLAAAEKLAADNAKRLAHEQQQATDAMKADVQNALQQVPFIGRFTAALGPATAGLAAVGAAAAIVTAEIALMKAAFDLGSKAVWSAFEAMDATSDSAEKLGMSATALSKLQVMAELAEVPTESLTSGIQKLEVAIGDAMAGSEESAKKFAALGLNFEELAALAPQDQFEAVAKKISAMGTQGEKLNAVFDIFGRGNTELVKMVSNYDAVQQQAEASGNVMTQAMTDIANAADADFRELKVTLAGLSKILAKEVLPAMGDMAKELTKLAKDENVRTLLVGTFQKAATAIQAIAEATKFWGTQTETVIGSLSKMSDILNSKPFMLLSQLFGMGLIPRSAVIAGAMVPGSEGVEEARRTMELDKRQSDLQNSLLEIEEKKTAELRSQLPLSKQMIEAQEKQLQLQQEGIAKRQEILDQLHGEIETMGMSREQLEQRRLAEEAIADTTIKDLGAVLDVIDAQAQELENLQAIRTLKEENAKAQKDIADDAARKAKTDQDDAERLKESLKTEEEITAERQARWRDLERKGLLSDEQVQQLIAKNTPTEKMKEAVSEAMPKTIRAGSAEAFRMAFGNRKPRTETLLEAIARNTDPKNNQTLEVVNAGLN